MRWLFVGLACVGCQPGRDASRETTPHRAAPIESRPAGVASGLAAPDSPSHAGPKGLPELLATSAPRGGPASGAAVTHELTSLACAPPVLIEHDPPSAPRNLEGLVRLLRDPDCSITHVKRDFGAVHDAPSSANAYELVAPVPGIARVTIGWVRAQNREYLGPISIELDPAAHVSVRALATRLGLQAQIGHVRLHSTCFDGFCPTLSFRDKTEPNAFSFGLFDDSRQALGSVAVGQLLVKSLYFPLWGRGCVTGTLQLAPTALPEPTPGAEQELLRAVTEAARELARTPYDSQRIKDLLEPYGFVRVDENALSKFRWVLLLPDEHHVVAPFCFSSFQYVRDPVLLCRIAYSGRHLYEIEGNKSHRSFLTVEFGATTLGPPALAALHVTRLELTLQPRGWVDTVF